MTLLNYWHYIFLLIAFIIFISGLVSALKQKDKKLIIPMIISSTVISIFLAIFSVFVVDKYTKIVKISKLKNKRLLSTENIIYTGFVKNMGNHSIGKVTLEIKLVNKGHVTGNVRAGSFYKPRGFMDYFGFNSSDLKSQPQTIIKEFVIAKNLKAGTGKPFRVYFKFPGYFRSVAHFVTVSGR